MTTKRRTHRMHYGRWSKGQARYFVTICTTKRRPGLTSLNLGGELHFAWDALIENGDCRLLCRTIMPDHMHILLALGAKLSLGQVVGKYKFSTRLALLAQGLSWQRDFFERRLRPDDEQEGYGLYIFLNPYRKRLIKLNEAWPGWNLDCPECFQFPALLREGRYPQQEWLGDGESWRRRQTWLK